MLTRGKLASSTGCNAETIRYFERIGLLPEPVRSQAGYRQYDDSHIRRLRFIQRAKSLGFSTQQIRDLLALSEEGGHTRAEVKQLTDTHIDAISEKIQDLKKIKDRLTAISSHCDGTSQPANTCPILDTLFDELDA
ncbi:MAG: helix-turn-helix domain-containing protein [Pseudomonadota bacterium]